MSLSRDVNLRTYRPPLHRPHSDQPLLSPKDGGHTPANCIDDSSATLLPRKTLSFLLFLSPFPPPLPSFFFLYLLPAERPRVINQIIRRVRLDFCLATFEFGSRGFDEGKDCCGGVDLPSFPPSPSLSRHTGSFPLSPSYTVCCTLGDSGLRRWPASQLDVVMVVAGTHRLGSGGGGGGGGALRGPTLVND